MTKVNNAGINSDDIQKTKDYADALDKLQNSLNGVNSALPEFSSEKQLRNLELQKCYPIFTNIISIYL